MCLQFGFVIFWQKDFGAKAAHKMLVKLPPGIHCGCKTFYSTDLEKKSEQRAFFVAKATRV